MAAARVNMKRKIVIGIALSSLILFIVPSAYAKTIIVQGKIDTSHVVLMGSTVTFSDTISHKIVETTTIRPDGTYYLSIPEGTYDISLIPPAQSGLPQTTKYHQQIVSNTTSDFVTPSPNIEMGKSKGWSPWIGVAAGLVILGSVGYFIWKRK